MILSSLTNADHDFYIYDAAEFAKQRINNELRVVSGTASILDARVARTYSPKLTKAERNSPMYS